MALAGALLRLWAMKILAKHFTFEVGIVKDHKCASLNPHRTIRLLIYVCARHLPCMPIWASVVLSSHHSRLVYPCRLVQSGPYRLIRHPGDTMIATLRYAEGL